MYLFLQIVLLLNTKYSKENDIEDISNDCISPFALENGFDSFEDLHLEIANTAIKNSRQENRLNMGAYNPITFVYLHVMNFPKKLKLSLPENF